jgi:hypothetical protein
MRWDYNNRSAGADSSGEPVEKAAFAPLSETGKYPSLIRYNCYILIATTIEFTSQVIHNSTQ